MAILMISDVAGQSAQGYDGMLGAVSDAVRRSPGFILHMSHPIEGGWRIVEVWDSRDDVARFFAAHIAPKLPDGIRPKLSFQPLHSILKP